MTVIFFQRRFVFHLFPIPASFPVLPLVFHTISLESPCLVSRLQGERFITAICSFYHRSVSVSLHLLPPRPGLYCYLPVCLPSHCFYLISAASFSHRRAFDRSSAQSSALRVFISVLISVSAKALNNVTILPSAAEGESSTLESRSGIKAFV